jgi:predicted GIY-YIG superfamily endonuclease
MRGVYLIHFDDSFGHARHYTGYSVNIPTRLEKHRNSTGAKLIRAVNAVGLGWQLARLWIGANQTFERSLKDRHGASKYCPVCQGRKRHEDIITKLYLH